MKNHSYILIALLAGCSPAVKVPLPPPVPQVSPPTGPIQPQFDRTFGEISVVKSASLFFRYKTINILIDPDYDVGQMAAISPQLDYLLFTDAGPRHFTPGVQAARKNLKIISSPDEAAEIRKSGFSEVKAVAAGQRIMLKKDDGFLFVSAVQSKNATTHRQVNSYLLEFDNGRNVFISGELTSADALRQFVYDLRDDGKEIYAGFFYRSSAGDDSLPPMISLLQPKNAVVLQGSAPSQSKVDQGKFYEGLKAELFEGPVLFADPGQTIPF